MGLSHLTANCVLNLHGHAVRLRVWQDEAVENWRWQIHIENGEMLDQGSMRTKVGAKVAAQFGLENRLRSAGSPVPTNYRWTETAV